jgi:hypothetical protein
VVIDVIYLVFFLYQVYRQHIFVNGRAHGGVVGNFGHLIGFLKLAF